MKWEKQLIPPHYLGSGRKHPKASTWPPDKVDSTKPMTDEEVAELEAKGNRKVRRAAK